MRLRHIVLLALVAVLGVAVLAFVRLREAQRVPAASLAPDYPAAGSPQAPCRRARAEPAWGCPFEPATTRASSSDYGLAFERGRSLSMGAGTAPVRCARIAELEVSSGRIVLADPIFMATQPALLREVPVGRYGVWLSFAEIGPKHRRVAALLVRLLDARPARWVSALGEGQGFPVDTGTAAITDSASSRLITSDAIFGEGFDQWTEWADICLERGSGRNVLATSTGWGDGVYASYWGEDAEGRVAALLVWFDVFKLEDVAPR